MLVKKGLPTLILVIRKDLIKILINLVELYAEARPPPLPLPWKIIKNSFRFFINVINKF